MKVSKNSKYQTHKKTQTTELARQVTASAGPWRAKRGILSHFLISLLQNIKMLQNIKRLQNIKKLNGEKNFPKSLTMPKKTEKEALWDISTSILSQNIK